MAGTSLLALLDDITTLLDDVGALTKVATKKTAGVLGDDLALNAEQVTGVRPERELPVVWAVAKGSALNKAILVPAALLLSAVAPWIIAPLLMLGGAFLCFEGFEKVWHKLFHGTNSTERQAKLKAVSDPKIDLVAMERDKIRGAILTDFILSAEIVVISLGTVQDAPFLTRALAVTAIASGVTVGVYLLVAGIVKMDDVGLRLSHHEGITAWVGRSLLWTAPRFLRLLSVLGTIAMFLVGGGILVHGTPLLHHAVHGAEVAASSQPTLGGLFSALVPTLLTGSFGLAAGGMLLGLFHLGKRAWPPSARAGQ